MSHRSVEAAADVLRPDITLPSATVGSAAREDWLIDTKFVSH